MIRRTPRAFLAAVTAAVVTLSACGSADSPAPAADTAGSPDDAASVVDESSPAAGDAAASDPGLRPNLPVENADSPLPPITVREVVDDRWVQFADILPAEQPVLLWFWAPF